MNLPLTLTLLHFYWLLLRLSRPPNVLQATGLVSPVYNAVSVLRSVSLQGEIPCYVLIFEPGLGSGASLGPWPISLTFGWVRSLGGSLLFLWTRPIWVVDFGRIAGYSVLKIKYPLDLTIQTPLTGRQPLQQPILNNLLDLQSRLPS